MQDLRLGKEHTLTLELTGTSGKPKFTFRPFAPANTHTLRYAHIT